MRDSEAYSDHLKLPEDFLLGAATAAHQVEGYNLNSDWWAFEQSGLLPFRSGEACGHYQSYERDFDIAQKGGHNCHRLSVEWSRVEPRDGDWNSEAVDHYADVFRALRERDLEPVVTLNHFTLPAWALENGGWVTTQTASRFARFVDRFVREAGDSVKFWLTINEPTVYVQQCYINGEWPPLERNAWVRAFRALKNLARAHVLAYSCIKRAMPDAKVGFAHSALHIEPCDSGRILDRYSSSFRHFLLNEVYFRLIGASAMRKASGRRVLDFIGVNYYTRCCVRAVGLGPSLLIGRACKLNHHRDSGIHSAIGWEVYPTGLAEVLKQYSKYSVPLFITENGIATDDDELRCKFLVEHLKIVLNAIAEGSDVIGYLHWSLIDNFEWHYGYGPRFGLAEVDVGSLERRAKPSAELFAQICRSRRVDSGGDFTDQQMTRRGS